MVKGTIWYVSMAIILGMFLSFLPKFLGYAAASSSLELAVFLGLFGTIALVIYVEFHSLLRRRRDLQEMARGAASLLTQRASILEPNSRMNSMDLLSVHEDTTNLSSYERALHRPVPPANRWRESSKRTSPSHLEESLKRADAELDRVGDRVVAFRCVNCGALVPNNSEYCPICGAKVSPNLRDTDRSRSERVE